MDSTPSDDLILRYLGGGTLSTEEAARVQRFLATNARRRGTVSGMQAALHAEDIDGSPPDPDMALAVFLQRFRQEYPQSSGKAPRLRRMGSLWWGGGRVGTLSKSVWAVLIASVITGVIFYGRNVPRTHTGSVPVYSTNVRQQAVLNLDDGSRVTLAPHSTLRVLHFGKNTRTFVLENGEAYFEVAHLSKIPFIVRSGVATAQVLGTSFLVRHALGDPQVRVAVTEGKVLVTRASKVSITLTTGQVGNVTDSTMQVSTRDDLAPGTEWASGRVMFRHTPLATVLATVSQWYGYHFRYADQTLAAQRVTMAISTQSSAAALATIENVLAVNLTVVGDTVTLVPQPLHSSRSAPRIQTYDVWTATREAGR